jgi:LysR family transcriptional regulator, regulator for bpeEF and oprC
MDKLRAIQFFCRAVESKSFSAAARALDIAPSVLSKTVSTLEADLRCTLFNRSTRRLSLTEAGAAYYEHCRRIVLDLEEADAAARDGMLRATGTLRVGVHPALRAALLGRLGDFLAQHPDLKVEIVITNSPSTLLEAGLDVLLHIGALADSSFVAHRLGWTRSIICASPAYLRGRRRPEHPRDLAAHRAIIPGRGDEESFARWSFARSADQEVVSVPVSLVVRDGVGLVDAAASGAGVGRIYEIAARRHLETGALVPLLTEWAAGREPVDAVLPGRRHVPAKVGRFLELARAVVADRGHAVGAPRR